ncbi:MAG: Eco57I restriction-modification methylase domain-containing protein [Gammaproteobacteria bacterium]
MKQTSRAEHRYGQVPHQKAAGSTYTPPELARFVANQIVRATRIPRNEAVRILDPAVGDGELLASLIAELNHISCRRVIACGFDTDKQALGEARRRLSKMLPDDDLRLEARDFLEVSGAPSRNIDLLDDRRPLENFDLVIANPPYVRTQILGASRAQELAQRFGLTGRVDLYYTFILGIRQVLRSDGVLGIIVSNRFMTTRSGQNVRQAVQELYELLHVWDLGDTKLFDAAVLPAVLLARAAERRAKASKPAFTSVYETTQESSHRADTAIAALDKSGVVALEDGRRLLVTHGCLDTNGDVSGVWRVATAQKDDWLANVQSRTYARFGDIGKIRVGVKTTADDVFIREDWETLPEGQRPEVLRPVITHHVARRYRAKEDEKSRQILYTHESRQGRRSAVNLGDFPRTRAYLESHREQLERRRYVIEAGRQWFEIWVPQDPEAWARPKLVFPDISVEPVFWIDVSGSIVNGDCYWLTPEPHAEKLMWLAVAVGNSDFAVEFYDHKFNNKLYAGRRRFITQYVSEFPIPDPALAVTQEIIRTAKAIYECSPSAEADHLALAANVLVHEAFNLAAPEVAR